MLPSLRKFDGEIPALVPHMLPHEAAQYALNCDFSEQSLTPLAAGSLLGTMVNNPVKGMFTEDGLIFYTWNTETLAFSSPIVSDTFSRMYYLSLAEGIIRVAQKTGMAVNGPSPATSYKVGVPRPTIAPQLKTVELGVLPDYPNVSISCRVWWNYNGTRYAETIPALTVVSPFREYSFSAPSYPGGAPGGVVPQLEVEWKFTDDNNSAAVLAALNFKTGSNGRSQGLPGGIEAQVSVDSAGVARVKFYWGIAQTTAYTYTYENIWGEESAPSVPATISSTYLQAVSIVTTAADFTGFVAYTRTNVYRTFGASSTYVQAQVTGSGTTYQDSANKPGGVGSALITTDWFPPDTGIKGMCKSTQGWFAFFKSKTLYATEPNSPHAAPYSYEFDFEVRGCLAINGGLLVTCTDGAYFGPGTTPEQVFANMDKMNLPQQGIAQRSLALVDGGAAYASQDGIALVVGSAGTMNASQRLFSRKDWRSIFGTILADASLRLAYFDGALVGSSNTAGLGFVIKLDERVGMLCRTDMRMDCMFDVPTTDSLLYSVGANVYKYRAGAAQSMDWWSRDYLFDHEVSLGAGYIECTGPMTLIIYADKVAIDTRTVTTGRFRIEPVAARRWSFRLQGTNSVSALKIARTMGELKRVE